MKNKIYIGAAYYPEHWPKERWPEDIHLMREAGINVLRVGELAWSFLEPEDGRFEFGWLDEFISMAYKEGIEVILGTPTEVTPTWLNYKYPEVISTDASSKLHGGRGNHCYNSPVLNKYVERIVDKMAGHFALNPAVIGWQIDNELRGTKCYCNNCVSAFRNWLQKRYGTLENLNEKWGTCFWSQVYNSWEEVTLPSESQLIVSTSQILDHFRFTSDSAVEFAKRQANIIKKYAPHQFITHNSLGLCEWVNLFKLGECLDYAGWDTYPYVDGDNYQTCMGHDLLRGTKHDDFWILEQKNGFVNYHNYNLAIDPGLVRIWAYQDIARGANGIVFYRWRSNRYSFEQNPNGILRHDGSPRQSYYEIKQLNKELSGFSGNLAGTKVESDIAIVYSYDQMWDEYSNKQYKNISYKEILTSYYKAVTGMGLTVDLIDPLSDLSGYKMVIAPCLPLLNEKIVKNFESFVKKGGYLVLGIKSGIKTWSGIMVDIPHPGLLSELAGIRIDEFEVLPANQHNIIEYNGKEYGVGGWLEMLEPKTASSLATYKRKFYSGKTAISKNMFGNGTVLYVGVMDNDELIRNLMADALQKCNINAVQLPDGVFITRRKDDKYCYTFIINMNREPVNAKIEDSGIDLIQNKYISGNANIRGLDLLIIKSDCM